MIVPVSTQRHLVNTLRDLLHLDPNRPITTAEIAREMGVSDRTVQRNMRPLLKLGIIERHTSPRGKGWAYIYRLN